MKRMFNLLFRRVSVANRINDELYQAKVDLLAAEAAREHFENQEKTLKTRIARLEKKHAAELKVSNVVELQSKQRIA